jgi:ASC-1-like (ASCH) protein
MDAFFSHQADAEINVSEPWFSYIGNQKTWEGRLNKERFKDFKKGMTLKICLKGNPSRCFYREIVDVRVFGTFAEALDGENIELEKVLPGVESREEGVKIYEEFYSLEEQKKHGVVMFMIRPRK